MVARRPRTSPWTKSNCGGVVFTPDSYRIELDIDGNKVMALLHETQFDPVTDHPIHAGFVEMNENKESRVALSLKLTGASKGVKEGGAYRAEFPQAARQGPSQPAPGAP
jgi:hypothetical protein